MFFTLTLFIKRFILNLFKNKVLVAVAILYLPVFSLLFFFHANLLFWLDYNHFFDVFRNNFLLGTPIMFLIISFPFYFFPILVSLILRVFHYSHPILIAFGSTFIIMSAFYTAYNLDIVNLELIFSGNLLLMTIFLLSVFSLPSIFAFLLTGFLFSSFASSERLAISFLAIVALSVLFPVLSYLFI